MEVSADYQALCGGCPIWDPATDSLYWTDCTGRRFYRYCPHLSGVIGWLTEVALTDRLSYGYDLRSG